MIVTLTCSVRVLILLFVLCLLHLYYINTRKDFLTFKFTLRNEKLTGIKAGKESERVQVKLRNGKY